MESKPSAAAAREEGNERKVVELRVVESFRTEQDEALQRLARSLDDWMARKESAPKRRSSIPLRVLVVEAHALARLLERLWQGSPEAGAPPPLSTFEGACPFGLERVRELQELATLVGALHAWARAVDVEPAAAKRARARFVLQELRRAVEYHATFEDRTEWAKQMRKDHPTQTHAQLALALSVYARSADAPELLARTRLDPALVSEAWQLSLLLLSRGSRRGNFEALQDRKEARGLRDRFLALLAQKMGEVRRELRFRYRGHPEVVRQATSEHERVRKRKNARAKKGQGTRTPPVLQF